MKFASVLLLALCGICCHAVMNKYTLPNTDVSGAVCLDGTPGIYYFKPGSKTNSTKWIMHFLGGGLCMSDMECFVRSKSYLGSSNETFWNNTYEYGGPLSEDPNYNPDFYDWNHVFFAYCDGGSFAGDKTDPAVLFGTEKIYYRGHRILTEVLNDLNTTKGLDKATDVLLVGDSSGGMATFFHADEIKDFLPDSVRFKAAPFSGVFLDRPNVLGEVFFRDNLAGVFNFQNCSGGVNEKCVKAYEASNEAWKCFFAEYTMEYIESPLLVANSASDAGGLLCVALGEPLQGISGVLGNCSSVPGWEQCEATFMCNASQWEKILEYPDAFRNIIENNPKMHADGSGLFEYDCYSHAIETSYGWNYVVVQQSTLREAVRRWFFSDNEPASKHTYKDCNNTGVPACNPTCVPPVPPMSSSSLGHSSTHHSSSNNSFILCPMMSVICAAFIALFRTLF